MYPFKFPLHHPLPLLNQYPPPFSLPPIPFRNNSGRSLHSQNQNQNNQHQNNQHQNQSNQNQGSKSLAPHHPPSGLVSHFILSFVMSCHLFTTYPTRNTAVAAVSVAWRFKSISYLDIPLQPPPLHCFPQCCNLAHLLPLYLLLFTHSCPLLIGTSRLRGLQQSQQSEQRFQWISIFIQVIQHCHVTLSTDDTCLLTLHASPCPMQRK